MTEERVGIFKRLKEKRERKKSKADPQQEQQQQQLGAAAGEPLRKVSNDASEASTSQHPAPGGGGGGGAAADSSSIGSSGAAAGGGAAAAGAGGRAASEAGTDWGSAASEFFDDGARGGGGGGGGDIAELSDLDGIASAPAPAGGGAASEAAKRGGGGAPPRAVSITAAASDEPRRPRESDAAASDSAPPTPRKSMFAMLAKSCAANVQPRHKPAVPSLEAMRAASSRPVYLTPDPSVTGIVYNASPDMTQLLPVNTESFVVDSEIFVGKVEVKMRGLATTDASAFDGKRRHLHVAAQGRFKRAVRLAAQCTGQEFNIPIHGGRSAEIILETILRTCAKVFSRTTIVDAHGERPYFLNPLAASAQLVNVALPGEEPEDMWAAEEDCRLVHPALADAAGNPVSSDKRRRWCDEPANIEGLMVDTDLVYTLQLWQHMVDFSTYRISVGGFMSFDICQMMSSQPLQIMVKDIDSGIYSYCMLIWHQRLLYPESEREEARERRATKAREAREARAAAGGGGGVLSRFW
ncbi:hypothetical protein Rsub_02307 [Raphidocelis subcapitata]|uniref:Domain of unknown function at the cortex 1 domain-containing protein n=1 Tax=Raphidocelis subcapitata TaxID=307507 RepID=A0A2V0NQM7_9CHLO|nr:hypothetical protein Rsub_02307 [Raphidocelis subcapitata]|eukprot:GBF89589.1 hypothetical protein Rsub_02307 [Raphidocelis subcapitata]